MSKPRGDLKRGLGAECVVLAWLRDFGFLYRKNTDDYGIDLVHDFLPKIEVKFEDCESSKRNPDGSLKNLCVQLYVKKWSGPLERSGPWKAVRQGGCESLYVVVEKVVGNPQTYRTVFVGKSQHLGRLCERYFPKRGETKLPPRVRRCPYGSQKLYALVPRTEIESINHGLRWLIDELRVLTAAFHRTRG
jgi:hypothetical protein